jgi:hypothetical protein
VTTPAEPIVNPPSLRDILPDHPRFPRTRAEAELLRPEWEAALVRAHCSYDHDRRRARDSYDRLERLRGQMDVIQAMLDGEFDEAEEAHRNGYAQGSRGPWPLNGYTPVQIQDVVS